MTHKPPVPPGNQSPYPIEEPPHPHPPAVPPAPAEPTSERESSPPAGLILGAVAAIAAIGLGVAATLLRRDKKPVPKPRKTGKRKT